MEKPLELRIGFKTTDIVYMFVYILIYPPPAQTGGNLKIYLAASERLIFLSQNMSVVSTVQLYMTTCVLGYIFQHSSLLAGACSPAQQLYSAVVGAWTRALRI